MLQAVRCWTVLIVWATAIALAFDSSHGLAAEKKAPGRGKQQKAAPGKKKLAPAHPTFPETTDPAEAAKDPDFAIQGEYLGFGTLPGGDQEKVGAQVIALGEGKFQAVVYRGGLPGEGWKRGDEQFPLEGQRQGDAVSLTGKKLTAKIGDGKLTISDADGQAKVSLDRTERKSPTLEAKPPKGALVLFDGSDVRNLPGASMSSDKNLIAEATSIFLPPNFTLHMEFRLSYMPQARGQARSNSGVYLHDAYEVQVLDSFGLEGANNECGGFYKIKEPAVNMCLPPLTWQTYDIDFTAPKYDADGKKTASARVTVKHNGVAIHQDLELPDATPGRQKEGPAPRPVYLQGHGCHVQYRNLWVVPKP